MDLGIVIGEFDTNFRMKSYLKKAETIVKTLLLGFLLAVVIFAVSLAFYPESSLYLQDLLVRCTNVLIGM